MSKFWRIALAWLLAMALPIQGYAAQTMWLCGPASHQGGALQAHAGHAHAHASMGGDDALLHGEAPVDTAAAEVSKPSPAHAKHAGKCSACSACCSVVAITTQVISVAVVPPELPEVATTQIAHDLVLVGGLERPPRFSRA